MIPIKPILKIAPKTYGILEKRAMVVLLFTIKYSLKITHQ